MLQNGENDDFDDDFSMILGQFSKDEKIPRAKNRALDRAFWCSPSCTKSWFLVLSLVPKIVL